MIDIHCHPLSGVDDGPDTLEASVAMCRMATADGITHLVATPHCNYRYTFQPEMNRRKLQELQAVVGNTPELLLGCDFNLSYDNICRLTDKSQDFTINGTKYLLVELGDQFVPEQVDQVFYDLAVASLTPILTHPERNRVVRRRPELLDHWVSRGCLVQVTAQSYTGGFGREPQSLVEAWLESNLVHFLASDAHDTKYRPPLLSPCYDKLAKAQGKEVAERLLTKNPEAVIRGLPLPPGPEPVRATEAKRRRRRWFSFLRG